MNVDGAVIELERKIRERWVVEEGPVKVHGLCHRRMELQVVVYDICLVCGEWMVEKFKFVRSVR
jgi:hypothetical protein